MSPAANPFQLAVLPNYPPVITHTSLLTAVVGQPLLISAVVSDNTNSIASVHLYYRIFGQLIYQQTAMVLTNGAFQATIPGSYVTSNNLEYFIKATDNFNVSSTHGTADNPHVVYLATGIDDITGSTFHSINYPNPFSESTTISYNVPEKCAVTIDVYDLNGKEIENLVNTTYGIGLYNVVFSTKELTGGIYYYSLKEISPDNGVIVHETRKLVIVK